MLQLVCLTEAHRCCTRHHKDVHSRLRIPMLCEAKVQATSSSAPQFGHDTSSTISRTRREFTPTPSDNPHAVIGEKEHTSILHRPPPSSHTPANLFTSYLHPAGRKHKSKASSLAKVRSTLVPPARLFPPSSPISPIGTAKPRISHTVALDPPQSRSRQTTDHLMHLTCKSTTLYATPQTNCLPYLSGLHAAQQLCLCSCFRGVKSPNPRQQHSVSPTVLWYIMHGLTWTKSICNALCVPHFSYDLQRMCGCAV